ncbi:LamG-like jellyroll fold domain-containing protein [Pseudoduganella namucuonensis]|uniref:Alginate lyase n=1 Tax=Pseudoduganella namucuonensis TaxID=1035707 RepID=A0A1I7H7F2_9BURK|nr:LamG-like jellyroll fold domain-containing protein [Pseudoduganella namucuonensis]SFU56633.1 Alginate lyase [Pseudoduganella namucuonensis]
MPNNDQKFSLKRRSICATGLGLAALGPLGLAGCGGDAGPAALDAAGAAKAGGAPRRQGATTARTFVHPGLLHTEADFTRMRAKVAAGAQPWTQGWNALTSNGRSQLGTPPRPLVTVTRSATLNNTPQMYIDIARTYQMALRWKVSGDTAYADQAVVFLNQWSSTMTTLTGNADRFLAAGIYGYQWANAAEIMRTYSGWAAADLARFQSLMLNVFYPLCHQFLVTHNDADITNYWANWDQCTIAAILAIGVLCDREDLYDEAMNYYKTGAGNGTSQQAVYYVHPGNLGQWQESGRDQGHCTLGVGLAASFCEMAWNQGDDVYSLDNNRFLAGAEYVAKTNLTDANGAYYTLPFATYKNVNVTQPGLSSAGRVSVRPVWAMVLNHYANRKGLAAPYCALQVAQVAPEGDGGNGDQLGFGTLTFSRDPYAGGVAPSGLTAWWSGGQMVLSWWGCANATGYTVKRATAAGGPYTTIASGITNLLTYTDSGMAPGAYYYVVTAQTPTGDSAPSAAKMAMAGTGLHTRLMMNETSGTTAADATGNGHAGTLVNGGAWVAGRSGNALQLDGVNDYVALPQDAVADLADFTIAAWVYWDASRNWARVFDFGSGTGHYMMLTPRTNGGVIRFGITTDYGVGEQGITGTAALPTGQWVHVAVTLSGATGTLYVNGAVAGSNTAMFHAPFRLGSTNQNWIGRSQYAADPYFNGKIDDFRIYRGALTAAEVTALVNS